MISLTNVRVRFCLRSNAKVFDLTKRFHLLLCRLDSSDSESGDLIRKILQATAAIAEYENKKTYL